MKRLQIPRAQPGAGQASCTDVQVGDKENRWPQLGVFGGVITQL